MNTIGFPVSNKENELRRALWPSDILKIRNKKAIYVECGFGKAIGFSDHDYLECGVNVVDRKTALSQSIICDPKIGDADYLDTLSSQVIFGWIHAVQNRKIVDSIISRNLTAVAWEEMFEHGRHIFYRNNEIAGEAAIFHAFMLHGISPTNANVAIVGKGNIARGAMKILYSLGANVTVYDRQSEKLLRQELPKYDTVVNAVNWDVFRKDHIIYKDDLKKMKPNSLIIDISCDRNGAVETSVPTTIENPTYCVDDVTHYVVDHTPSIFFKTASKSISEIVSSYLDPLIEGAENEVLDRARIITGDEIHDARILSYQRRSSGSSGPNS